MEAYKTSAALSADDPPHERFMYALGAAEQVTEAMEPSEFAVGAHAYAVRAWREYEHYGFPYPGTVRDQPMIWRLAVDAITEARAEGEAQAAAEARAQQREGAD